MAHKVLDGGTAYEITGGKVMDGGAVYSIDRGKVMDGGTVYDISFGSGMLTVEITGSGNDFVYVTINGVKYISAQTIEVEPGTIISTRLTTMMGGVTVNGSYVQQGSGSYNYTVATDIVITLTSGAAANIAITTK